MLPSFIGTRNQIQMKKERAMFLVKGHLLGRKTFLIDNLQFYMHFLFLIRISLDPVSNILDISWPTNMEGSLANTQDTDNYGHII